MPVLLGKRGIAITQRSLHLQAGNIISRTWVDFGDAIINDRRAH